MLCGLTCCGSPTVGGGGGARPRLSGPSGLSACVVARVFHRFARCGFELMRQAPLTTSPCGIRGPVSGNFSIPMRRHFRAPCITIIRPNLQPSSPSKKDGLKDRPEASFHRLFSPFEMLPEASKPRQWSNPALLMLPRCTHNSDYPSLGLPEAHAGTSPSDTLWTWLNLISISRSGSPHENTALRAAESAANLGTTHSNHGLPWRKISSFFFSLRRRQQLA